MAWFKRKSETVVYGEKLSGRCPYCNTLTIFRVKFRFIVFAILFLIGYIPGIVYWLLTRNRVVCTSCGRTAKLHPATKWMWRRGCSTTTMPKCTYCGYEGPFIRDFSWFTALFLSCFFILPGIIYIILCYNRWVCPVCGTPPGAWV